MKKFIVFFAFSFFVLSLFGQIHNQIPQNDISTSTNLEVLANKGNKVYLNSSDTFSIEGLQFLKEGLQEFNYWTIVDSPDKADFIILLKCKKQQQMTVVAVYSSSSFINANGEIVLQTKEYKCTPTAFNKYNSFKGSVTKMIDKAYKKKWL